MTACNTGNKSKAKKEVDEQTNEERPVLGKPEKLQLDTINGYFVKNTVNLSDITFLVFDSREDFESYYGIARTMTDNVDNIDFTTSRVGAIIVPETDKKTSLKITKAERIGTGAVVTYQITTAKETQSFTTVPTLLFKLPSDNRLQSVTFESGEFSKKVEVVPR